jgi:tRNA A-37 threonylcarbamoyl transferase component Bud32
MSYTKQNVSPSEYNMHKIIYELNIVNMPKIYDYNDSTRTLIMEKIPSLNISDMYGEKFSDVPTYITDEIYNIISILYKNNIEYPDITGYNFIEYENKIWIIDFEHSKINLNKKTYDPYISKFINKLNTDWNPRFK